MTKKDYIKMAEVFRDEKERLETNDSLSAGKQADCLLELSIMVGKMAYMLQCDNPRFDRQRFLSACGYN